MFAVRKECVGRGLAMWIAWVAAEGGQRVGPEIGPEKGSANDAGWLCGDGWQQSTVREDSDLLGIDGTVAGLAFLIGKCGEVNRVGC